MAKPIAAVSEKISTLKEVPKMASIAPFTELPG